MNEERLSELVAAFSSGEITAEERRELLVAIRAAGASARDNATTTIDSAALLALLIKPEKPSAALREKLMARTRKPAPVIAEALSFMPRAAESEWIPMKVPGAFVKLLSMDQQRGYAVALGKLEANSSYPAHTHHGPENVFVLSGDLSIGTTRLGAGDFHHADVGSRHEASHSEAGCTILIVLTTEDLMAQMA